MVDFQFELLPGGELPYENASGHVTITNDHRIGTSKPNHSFMVAVSLEMLLGEAKEFLLHGKMTGFTWAVIDAQFSVSFPRVTHKRKGQQKPLGIHCKGIDLGTVSDEEFVHALADGVHCFLQDYAGCLGIDEAELRETLCDFEAAFGLGKSPA